MSPIESNIQRQLYELDKKLTKIHTKIETLLPFCATRDQVRDLIAEHARSCRRSITPAKNATFRVWGLITAAIAAVVAAILAYLAKTG